MDLEQIRSIHGFFQILASANRGQLKKIIATLSKKQVKNISHIAYNIIFNDLLKAALNNKVLKRKTKAVKHLATRRICLAEKKTILVRNPGLVQELCKIGEQYFSDYLE
jgi:hypothetical protein